MAVQGLRRIIVSVADRERALALYRDALGLTVKYGQGELVMLAVPGTQVELLLHERPPTPGMAGVAASFTVDDVDASAAAAEQAGATIIDAPADQPWGERQAVLTDPDGHVICLVARPPERCGDELDGLVHAADDDLLAPLTAAERAQPAGLLARSCRRPTPPPGQSLSHACRPAGPRWAGCSAARRAVSRREPGRRARHGPDRQRIARLRRD